MSTYLDYILPELKLLIFDKLIISTTDVLPYNKTKIDFLNNSKNYVEYLGIDLNDYIKYKYGSNIIYNAIKILDDDYKISLIIYMQYFNLSHPFTIIKELESIVKYTDTFMYLLKSINDSTAYYEEEKNYYLISYMTDTLLYLRDLVFSDIDLIKTWAIKSMIIFYINYNNSIQLYIQGYDFVRTEKDTDPEYLDTIKDVVWIDKKMYQIFNEDIINKLSDAEVGLDFIKKDGGIIMKKYSSKYEYNILIEDLITMIKCIINQNDVGDDNVALLSNNKEIIHTHMESQ
jgi:hypothetical protein